MGFITIPNFRPYCLDENVFLKFVVVQLIDVDMYFKRHCSFYEVKLSKL